MSLLQHLTSCQAPSKWAAQCVHREESQRSTRQKEGRSCKQDERLPVIPTLHHDEELNRRHLRPKHLSKGFAPASSRYAYVRKPTETTKGRRIDTGRHRMLGLDREGQKRERSRVPLVVPLREWQFLQLRERVVRNEKQTFPPLRGRPVLRHQGLLPLTFSRHRVLVQKREKEEKLSESGRTHDPTGRSLFHLRERVWPCG